MIYKFLKNLFCRHDWVVEESNLTGDTFEYCNKCGKWRVIK